jgi:sulfide:quinone oxidoreductase
VSLEDPGFPAFPAPHGSPTPPEVTSPASAPGGPLGFVAGARAPRDEEADVARVLVIGGGFGGLAAATGLRERLAADDEVVLVARDDTFAMGFAKLWDLAGLRPLAQGTRPLARLEDRDIRFLRAEVTGVDPSHRTVGTADGGTLEGDALVVALGARPAPPHRALLDGAAAHDLYDPAALPAMREALGAIRSGRVVISILGGPFRCPPAPYEAALIVDRLLRDRGVRENVEVVVTTPQPMSLPVAGVDASRYVASHLGDAGVELRAGTRVVGVDHDEGTLELGAAPGALPPPEPPAGGAPVAAATISGARLGFDLWLGVPADTPPAVLVGSPLAGPSGWIEPDPHTLRTGFERVYAVGDCTVIPTPRAQLPHAGVFAAAQADVAAANVAADLTGSPPARFDGHGYCFLELPGEQVAYVEGDFYADPPAVSLTPADHEQFRRKQAYEHEHLAAWLG